MLRLDGSDLFGSAHGLWTVLKVVLVAAMVFIGLSARQFAQKRLNRARELTVPMADRLRRAFGTEAAIGIVTLLASSWLLSLTPANVNAEPGIDYAITQTILVPEADLDVTVKLTRNNVGNSGLEVTVNSPAEGLTGLEVMLTPPYNTMTGAIVQPVPLPGAGVATRSESVGLPIIVPGDWLLQINAQTAAGVVQSDPVLISILDETGAAPTTSITIPEPILVPIETPTSPTTLAGG
jgi:copper transport protein